MGAAPNKIRRLRGRPSRLTPERAARVLSLIEGGNHITTACEASGIHRATLYRWLARADEVDRAIENGSPFPLRDLPYRDFRDRLHLARARAEVASSCGDPAGSHRRLHHPRGAGR